MTAGGSPSQVQAAFAATLVDEWLRAGVDHAVVSPGSRSTPVALALAAAADSGRLRLQVRLDERSAGFVALGLGLATGRPAVVLTTSGTAAVELHPAVVEAHQARVPLLVCTADRPPELHQVGAPQTIEQAGLYGSALRWAADPGVARASSAGSWRSLAARAVAEARCGPAGPGPVHLNLALAEPLVAGPGRLPPGRPGGRPWHRSVAAPALPPPDVVAEMASRAGRRGVVVAGAGAGDAGAIHEMACALGWPVLADPRSGARLAGRATVAAADALLRVPALAGGLKPEIILRLGAPWASKALASWLSRPGRDYVVVDPWWAWADPERAATTMVRADPTLLARAVAGRLEVSEPLSASSGTSANGPGRAWLEAWARAEAAAQEAIDAVLGAQVQLSEPAVARQVMGEMAPGATLVVASSMPVRDLEWYAPALVDPPRVLANRGANGIDGTVATTLGVASAGQGPTLALLGDLAFLHDAGSLMGAVAEGLAATLVVVDNRGGGIFSFLAQAGELEAGRFERLFGTPQDADVAEVAAAYRVATVEVDSPAALGTALARAQGSGTVGVVRVRTDRAANVSVHEEIHAAVRAAVGE